MLQQIIALVIITLFIWRLLAQKQTTKITTAEFHLWLVFWLLGAIAIIFIKKIDAWVEYLGFSSGGINFLLYLAVIVLFYLIFRLRLHIAKLDSNLTTITRQMALTKIDKEQHNKPGNN